MMCSYCFHGRLQVPLPGTQRAIVRFLQLAKRLRQPATMELARRPTRVLLEFLYRRVEQRVAQRCVSYALIPALTPAFTAWCWPTSLYSPRGPVYPKSGNDVTVAWLCSLCHVSQVNAYYLRDRHGLLFDRLESPSALRYLTNYPFFCRDLNGVFVQQGFDMW